MAREYAGLGSTAQQDGAPAGLCRFWERGRQSRDRSGLGTTAQQDGAPAGLCRTWEPWRSSGDRAGLGTTAQHDGDPAGLCRPCGGGAWPGREHRCLWSPGLKSSSTEILQV
jgi:hypothetical protein